jgi:hypothetical protein
LSRFPVPPIACRKARFEPDLIDRFRRALVRTRDERRGQRLLEFLRLSGFEAVPDDCERHLASIVKTYPGPAR